MHGAPGCVSIFTFDLALLGEDRDTQSIFWSLLRRDAFDDPAPLLDRAIESSARHGLAVCAALGSGMLEALDVLLVALTTRTRRQASALLFEQALTVLYRVLFLLFAEGRGLVPIWHPVYRDRYSLEAIVATSVDRAGYRGLVGRGSRHLTPCPHRVLGRRVAGDGIQRTIVRASTPDVFDGTPVSDTAMSRAVLAVSTTSVNRHGRRARIAYRDLDVEQLGAVYERVLVRAVHVGPRGAHPHARSAQSERHLLHPARGDRASRPAHARAARAWQESRRDPDAPHSRSRNGQWRVSRRGVPVPRRGGRSGADRGGTLASA